MKVIKSRFKLTSSGADISLSSKDEVKAIVSSFTQQASRRIDIISKNLDPFIFTSPEFIYEIKRFSISGKLTQTRILINSSESLLSRGHRLIDLSQQLSSSIEIRKVSEHYMPCNETYSLYDSKGVVFLRQSDRYEGFANDNHPRLVAELSDFFNEIWEHSEVDPNLRRLHI